MYGKLADPSMPGYGGYEWPFSITLAIGQPGYRRGVQNATINANYAINWRAAATDLLTHVNKRVAEREIKARDAARTLATWETGEL